MAKGPPATGTCQTWVIMGVEPSGRVPGGQGVKPAICPVWSLWHRLVCAVPLDQTPVRHRTVARSRHEVHGRHEHRPVRRGGVDEGIHLVRVHDVGLVHVPEIQVVDHGIARVGDGHSIRRPMAVLRSLYLATAADVAWMYCVAPSTCWSVGGVVQFGVCILWPASVLRSPSEQFGHFGGRQRWAGVLPVGGGHAQARHRPTCSWSAPCRLEGRASSAGPDMTMPFIDELITTR